MCAGVKEYFNEAVETAVFYKGPHDPHLEVASGFLPISTIQLEGMADLEKQKKIEPLLDQIAALKLSGLTTAGVPVYFLK